MYRVLKPCPFCGSQRVTIEQSAVQPHGADVVMCQNCLCSVSENHWDWNNRADLSGKDTRVEAYLNLTNGLEELPSFKDVYKVIRIQSTACEQARWDFILSDLDNGFLFDLAIGKLCVVMDCSQKKQCSRALYQGIPWVEYVLNRVWFDREKETYVKKHNVTEYFRRVYNQIPPPILKKLKYFRKFLLTDSIKIVTICGRTTKDGDYEYFRNLIKKGE